MTTTIPAKLKKSQVSHGGPQLDFTDNATAGFHCLLVAAGSGAPNVTDTGVEFVADVTAANAEVTGGSYARQTLTGVGAAYDGTVNTQTDWTFANIAFGANTTGARYAVIYSTQVGSTDATYPVVAICDLGAAYTSALTLTCPTGGLIYWN